MPEPGKDFSPIQPKDILLCDPKFWSDFSRNIYDQASQSLKRPVTAESKNCTVVNQLTEKDLKQKFGISTFYLEHEPHRGVPSHGFVEVTPKKASHSPEKTLVDLQYLQFVPEESRTNLTPWLVVDYTNPEQITEALNEHHIPEMFHEYWLDELFPRRS